MRDEVTELISEVSRPRGAASRFLGMATMLTMLNEGVRQQPTRDIGPEPHVYTVEEGQEIARQIAAQRRAKRRKG